MEVSLGAVLIQGAEHAPRLVGRSQLIRPLLLIREAVGTGAGAGGAVAGEIIPLVVEGRGTSTTVLIERGGRGRAVSCIGARADVLAIATGTTGGGTRIDRGGGVTFQGGGALMTAKNAGTEARGVLVQFAGRSTEFQREPVLTHDGQKLSLRLRQAEWDWDRIGSRNGIVVILREAGEIERFPGCDQGLPPEMIRLHQSPAVPSE